MNDVREAIERVGAPFVPPGGGFEDLSRRRTRGRRQRQFAVATVALVAAAGGSLLAFRALSPSGSGPNPKMRVVASWPAASTATTSPGLAAGPICPTPSGGGPPPVLLSSESGAAGSSIELSGTFQTGQLWLQLWWNAGEAPGEVAPPPWPPAGPHLRFAPAGPGPAEELAAVEGPATTGTCSFRTMFTVPDVEPGVYRVQWVFGGANVPGGQGGYALWTSPVTFRVTP